MENTEKIRAYLAGELPMEEAQAFEDALGQNPELAMALELHHLDEDLTRYAQNELELELNGWLPGLETLRHSGVPLWLLSLLTGTLVIGMAGARTPRQKKVRRSGGQTGLSSSSADLANPEEKAGRPAADDECPPPGGR